MAALKAMQRTLHNISQLIATGGQPSRPATPEQGTPRLETPLLEDGGEVLHWTLCRVPTANQLVVEVLEEHCMPMQLPLATLV